MPTVAAATAEAIHLHNYKAPHAVKPEPLEGISEKQLGQHRKLYEGCVRNTHALCKGLREAMDAGKEANTPEVAELQRRYGYEYNGMTLHEYYFSGLKKNIKVPSIAAPLIAQIVADYGSFSRWKKNFTSLGNMRGTGWVITYYDPLTEHLTNVWASDHELGHVAGCIPLIVMDCWEHAYMLDYGISANSRADYVNTYVHNMNWEILAARFDAAATGLMFPRTRS